MKRAFMFLLSTWNLMRYSITATEAWQDQPAGYYCPLSGTLVRTASEVSLKLLPRRWRCGFTSAEVAFRGRREARLCSISRTFWKPSFSFLLDFGESRAARYPRLLFSGVCISRHPRRAGALVTEATTGGNLPVLESTLCQQAGSCQKGPQPRCTG